jgi:hypothetical protein
VKIIKVTKRRLALLRDQHVLLKTILLIGTTILRSLLYDGRKLRRPSKKCNLEPMSLILSLIKCWLRHEQPIISCCRMTNYPAANESPCSSYPYVFLQLMRNTLHIRWSFVLVHPVRRPFLAATAGA